MTKNEKKAMLIYKFILFNLNGYSEEELEEMDNEGRILKQFNDARDKREKNKVAIQKSGLTARELPDSVFDKNHLNESKYLKPKKLIFKHSRFINESQVYSRIPEEYKNPLCCFDLAS